MEVNKIGLNVVGLNVVGGMPHKSQVTYKRYLGSDSKYYVTSDGKTYCVRN